MAGSLNYKICVVEKSPEKGLILLNKLGNLFVVPNKGSKYLFLDKSLTMTWLARGIRVPVCFMKFLKIFVV